MGDYLGSNSADALSWTNQIKDNLFFFTKLKMFASFITHSLLVFLKYLYQGIDFFVEGETPEHAEEAVDALLPFLHGEAGKICFQTS